MKLEVGMYARTKKGIIQIYAIDNRKIKWKYLFKLKQQDEDGCVDLGVLCEENILKANYNILDLIEKDDVIAYYNSLQDIKDLIIERVQDNDYIKRLRKFVEIGTINIVRVLTHEQFEQYSYKIGE